MKEKIYVEDRKMMDKLGWFSTALDLEKECEKVGYHFSQDDMYDCYVSHDENCEVFEYYGEI